MMALQQYQENQDLDKLEIKHQILTDREIEVYIKKLKTKNQNLQKEFECSICFNFSHDPINCSKCDFKACFKCFDEYKYKSKNVNCIQCGQDKPMKNISYLKVRENSFVFCGNNTCFNPKKKILLKHYVDHLIFCLKRDKCPNECGTEIKSLE